MRTLLSLAVAIALSIPGWQARAGTSAAAPHPIVVLVSLDGFRWDYPELRKPPTILKLAAEGVRAERLISQFPTLTFPNHYTIVTGLRPAHHGIISGAMFDPEWNAIFKTGAHPAAREGRWWGGEPLWNTAERQGLIAACNFWPGSEAPIGGHMPTIWKPYDKTATLATRVPETLAWLDLPPEQRPSFITFYMYDVDVTSHRCGTDDPETIKSIADVDHALGELVAGVEARGLSDVVNFIVVSDHGMLNAGSENIVFLDDLIDPALIQVDCSGEMTGLRPLGISPRELRDKLRGKSPHYRAYLTEDLPERFHFSGNRRIPPVIVLAEKGWRVSTRENFKTWTPNAQKGAHGYDPEFPEMGAIFIARGPAFKRGVKIRAQSNLDIYNLVCAVLHVTPAPNDGSMKLAKAAMKVAP